MQFGEDILFRVGVDSHPETSARLKALGSEVVAAQQSITASVQTVGSTAVSQIEQIKDAAESAVNTAVGDSVGGDVNRIATELRETFATLSDVAAPINESVKASTSQIAEDLNRAGRESAQEFRSSFAETIGQQAGLSNDEIAILTGSNDDAMDRVAKESAASYSKSFRSGLGQQLGLTQRELDDIFEGTDSKKFVQSQKEAREETAQLNATITDQNRIIQGLDSGLAEASGKINNNFREMAAKGEEAASGIGQLASGVAFLFAQNESAQELVNTLLGIKGVTDIALGFNKTISGTIQFISLWKERTALQSAQQTIANEKTTIAAARTKNLERNVQLANQKLVIVNKELNLHSASLAKVAVEANTAAAAERNLANATATAGAAQGASRRGGGGRFGGIIASGASILGAEALFSATGSGTGGVLAQLGLEGLISGVTGSTASLTALATTTAAVTSAFVGVSFAATSTVTALKAAGENGIGGGAQVDGFLDTVAQYEVGIAGFLQSLTGGQETIDFLNQYVNLDAIPIANIASSVAGYQRSLESLARTEAARAANLVDPIQEALNNALDKLDRSAANSQTDRQLSNRSALRAQAVGLGDITQTQASRGNAADVARELAQQLQTVQQFTEGANVSQEQYTAALSRSNDLAERLRTAQNATITAIRAEAAERRKANDEAVSALQKRLDLSQKEEETARASLKTARQRFAALDQEEQLLAVRAIQQARNVGAQSLTREQTDLLGRVGDTESNRFVDQSLALRANRAGFNQFFGRGERQAIAQNDRTQARLNFQIEARQNVNVKIEQDEQRQARFIADQIRQGMRASERRIQILVQQQLQQDRQAAVENARNQVEQRNFEERNES